MNKNRILIALCAILIALSAVMIPLLAGTVYAEEGKYDYSRPVSSHNKESDSSDVLSAYLGAPISEVERNYLALHGGVKLRYDAGIGTSNIAVEYDSATTSLSVTAYLYSYDDVRGNRIVWVPTVATLKGESIAMLCDGERYTASFHAVEEDDSLYVEVDYTISFTVEEADMQSIVNKAFLDAPSLKAELESRNAEYIRLKEAYDAGLVDYEQYIADLAIYEAQYSSYTDYLKKKRIYEDALGEYLDYLDDLDAYNKAIEDYTAYEQALKEYNSAYTEYRAYVDALAQYNKKTEKYNQYLNDKLLVANQLAVLDAAKVNMAMGRQVYSAIMGNLVDTVLQNKDLITGDLVNVPAEVVDGAGKATENLRVLLQYYFSLTEEQDKYAYYTINYEAFRDNFTLLAQCLDQLYSNRRVRAELIYQDKDEKYIILVAQLAIIANALNDGCIKSYYGDYSFDKSYTIEKKTIAQILENKTYFDDTGTALPLAEGYPAYIDEPVKPTEVTEPIKPTPVSIPASPQEVPPPGDAPTPMDAPIRPEPKEHPGDEPIAPSPGEEVVALIEAYGRSELYERPLPQGDFVYTVTKTVAKKLFNLTYGTVVFSNPDGSVIYSSEVDIGSCADYVGPLPTKSEDAAARYYFDGWVCEDGSSPNLDCVESDLVLYPSFRAETKYYDVTFIVDGISTTLNLPYGADPTPRNLPQKPRDNVYEYSFSSWDKPIGAVCEDVSYVAVFDRNCILPLPSGAGATVLEEEGRFVADYSYSYTPVFNIARLVSICAESYGKGILIRSPHGALELSYSTVLELESSKDTLLSLGVVSLGGGGYTYSVSASGGEGKSYRISAKLPCGFVPAEGTNLYTLSPNGERSYVKYSYSEGMVSFNLTTDISYTLSTFYSVNVIPCDALGLAVNLPTASPGDRITLSYTVPVGVTLNKLYYVANGAEHIIEGDSFFMPHSDVAVGASFSYDEYKIVFMNGDKVLSVAYYTYGQTVTVPKDPSRVNSAMFSYTFRGWSPEVGVAVADAVYRAEYDMEYLPYEEPSDELLISPGIMKLLVAGGIALAMIVTVVIPTAVCLIVVWRCDRRYYQRKGCKHL